MNEVTQFIGWLIFIMIIRFVFEIIGMSDWPNGFFCAVIVMYLSLKHLLK